MLTKYLTKFSNLVEKKVIESNWVPGALDFLKVNSKKSILFIVTATPQKEIENIINKLNISHYFKHVIGSPTSKIEAVKSIVYKFKIKKEETLMIGDTKTDYFAAEKNKISFILRKTNLNVQLQKKLNCNMINDFKDLNW